MCMTWTNDSCKSHWAAYLITAALQVDAGAASTHSRPAGIVVFRRGKLPMRVGMSQDEFTHLVVYQAAAQLSLSKVGYQFDDF